MEDDRVAILEAQLAQAKLIAEEADKKYEEVRTTIASSPGTRRAIPFFPPWSRKHTHTYNNIDTSFQGTLTVAHLLV